MSTSASPAPSTPMRAPWPLTIVAWLFLAYSVLAAFDYGTSMVLGDDYYKASGMTPSQAAYFAALPGWVTVAWTASVWGGLFGAIALVLRRRLAVPLLAMSAAGTLLYIVYTWGLSDGIAAMGMLWFMPALIGTITAGLAWYASRMARRGLLR